MTRRLAPLILAATLLTGCGFQLRGATELPIQTFYSSVGPTSPPIPSSS